MAHIRTKAGLDALDLTPAEIQLIEAAQKGEACELGDGSLPAIGPPLPDRHIHADVLRYLILGGCKDCPVDDIGVWLQGAHITGFLNLDFSIALGAIRLPNCRFDKRPNLEQTQCSLLGLDGCFLPGLRAPGLISSGTVYLRKITSTACIKLNGAKIGGQLTCNSSTFRVSDEDAIIAQRAEISGGTFLQNIHTNGTIDLVGAILDGQLNCESAHFEIEDGNALDVQGAHIKRGVFLRKISTNACIKINSATIDGQLSCRSAKFFVEGGNALNARGTIIRDGVFLRKIEAHATITLAASTIGKQLDCTGASFDVPNGTAFTAESVQISERFIWQEVNVINGTVKLTSAHLHILNDDPDCWPDGERTTFDGMTYTRIAGIATDAKSRLDWLGKGTRWKGEFYPQPYTQLAKVLRDMGHDGDARLILENREELLRRDERHRMRAHPIAQNPVAALFVGLIALFHWVFIEKALKYLIGYGHRPFKSLWTLALLIAATIIPAHMAWEEGSFAPNSALIQNSESWQHIDETEQKPAQVWAGDTPPANWKPPTPNADWAHFAPGQDWETFNRYAYGLDVIIPIINFGQTEAWAPSTNRGWWGQQLFWLRWVLSAFGWIVTALGAAITGIIRRD